MGEGFYDAFIKAIDALSDKTVIFDRAFQLAKSQATDKRPVTDAAAAAYANDATSGDLMKLAARACVEGAKLGLSFQFKEYRR